MNGYTYHGAYCLDQYPTSSNTTFVNQYYRNDEGVVDYLIFNEDDILDPNDIMESELRNYVEEIVFKEVELNSGEKKSYEVLDMTLENKAVNELSDYLDRFKDKYDMEKIA